MNSLQKIIHRLEKNPTSAFALVIGSLFFVAILLFFHVRSVREVRDVFVPLAQKFSLLEQRAEVLQEQVELVELHAAQNTGSARERFYRLIVPEEFADNRLADLLELLKELEGGGVEDFFIGAPGEDISDNEFFIAHALPLEIRFASAEGVEQFLSLLALAGSVTIGDVLAEEEFGTLLRRIEREPASIGPFGGFLSTDLLTYARQPELVEGALLQRASVEGLGDILGSVVHHSLLTPVRHILGGALGEALYSRDLWPLPFMTIGEMKLSEQEEGAFRTELSVLLYMQRKSL